MLAVRHLAGLGRRRIAHITGPERFEAVRLRDSGLSRGARRGRPRREPATVFPGRWSEAWGREASRRFSRGGGHAARRALLRQRPDRPRRRRRPARAAASPFPADVAVVGFDNWEVMAEAARPPLTSVDMNLDALGREAGDGLLEMIAGARRRRRAPAALLAGRRRLVRSAGNSTGRRLNSMSETRIFPGRLRATCSSKAPFWRERLETVLTRTIPSQHAKLGEVGILDSLKLPKPVPPLTIPRNSHGFTVQVFWDSDVGKWIEAASYALVAPARRRDRGQDRRDRRRSRQGAVARRLSQLLVQRPRAGKALDQSARQPRTLQRRPSARRRHRLFPRHRAAALPRHHGAIRRSHRRDFRRRAGAEARLSRASGDRAGARSSSIA